MTSRQDTSDIERSGSFTLDVERQLDQICNRFEAEWKAGKQPSIEDFLGDWADERRTHLLQELIPLDIHHRRLRGEEPIAADYQSRFPSLDPAWLAGAVASRQSVDVSSTIAYRPVVPEVRSGKYAVKKFHARGGMGEVWVADDCEIGREVALKKIRQDRAKQRDRFLAEAQITGQMEHPGIVPVHELAQDESGLPFYVMKLVPGRSLKEVIEEFHSSDRSDESSRKVGRIRLLKIFVDLCNTVAYAHNRGVLHRDLKPDNVMVGNFGETLVLDWGLAKVMHQSELPGSGSYVHSTYTDHSEETHAGSVLGAPAYMAPEMAEGRSAEVDQRTDIYLLGSTLYSILTGEPPRSGKSYDEMIEMARTVPPPPPRQVDRSIPRALEAICLKAMSRRRQDRYATALALAEDVQHYLAGEPVTAYRESLPERAWRWARRHRHELAWTAAALMLLAVIGTAGVKIRAAQMTVARETARKDLAKFRDLADEVHFLAANREPVNARAPYYDTDQGEARAREALKIVEPWGPNLAQFALNGEAELVAAVKREIYDLMILLAQVTIYPVDAAAEKRAVDADVASEAATEALKLLDRAQVIGAPSRSYYRLRAECLTTLGDSDGAEEANRMAEDRSTPMTAHDYFLQAERHRNQSAPEPGAPQRIGEPNRELDRAVDLYRQAIEREPKHFWSHLQLGRCLIALSRREDAIAALSTAIGLHPESPWGYSTRGLVYAMAGRFDDALRDLDPVVKNNPQFRPALLNRGIVHWMQKEYDAAEADFEAVLQPPDDRRLIEAAYYRAQVRFDHGKYREALADIELMVSENRKFRPAYLSLARAHFSLGEEAPGLDALNSYLAGQPEFDPNSREAHAERGGLLRRLIGGWGLPDDARRNTQKLALTELHEAVQLGVRTPALYKQLGALRDNQGGALPRGEQRTQLYKRAKVEYSTGIDMDPNDFNLRNNRGWALIELGEYDHALADFSVASRLVASRLDPKNWSEVIALVEAHTGLGQAYASMGQVNDAQREATRALAILQDHKVSHWLLFHNVACIYAVLAKADAEGRDQNEEIALEFLRRAVTKDRASEMRMIKKDQHIFPETMQEEIGQL